MTRIFEGHRRTLNGATIHLRGDEVELLSVINAFWADSPHLMALVDAFWFLDRIDQPWFSANGRAMVAIGELSECLELVCLRANLLDEHSRVVFSDEYDRLIELANANVVQARLDTIKRSLDTACALLSASPTFAAEYPEYADVALAISKL